MAESCCLHLFTGDHVARLINCCVRWPHTGPGHRPPQWPSLCPHSSQRRKGKRSLSSEPPAACDLGRNLSHCPARPSPASGCPATQAAQRAPGLPLASPSARNAPQRSVACSLPHLFRAFLQCHHVRGTTAVAVRSHCLLCEVHSQGQRSWVCPLLSPST